LSRKEDTLNTQQGIVPCLWFDGDAEEAVSFYTSLFSDARIHGVTRYGTEGQEITGQPPGTVMTVDFELDGYRFTALNGGPEFKFTPATSLYVTRASAAEVDALWDVLSDGGQPLMELGTYEWSPRYGWLQDRYGVTWQLTVGDLAQPITPSLLFVGEQHGRAEEAMQLYTEIFPHSAVDVVARYAAGEGDVERYVKYGQFRLGGETFIAMDGGLDHAFSFTEAISLQIACESQEEVDHFWASLISGGGEEQPCGWLKDRFGVSWQVVPTVLQSYLNDPDRAKVDRVMRAFLQMTKLDIATLTRAYEG
jgi:predicted 3-demethylubiquinone-9 3-methyltransferase (glyoxalase superfamily)